MATYMSNKAQGRKSATPTGAAASVGSASEQQKSVDQASKFRTVDTGVNDKYNCGNQVKVQANDKGTGVVGRPSSIGESAKDFASPATANPSGAGNKTTSTYWK